MTALPVVVSDHPAAVPQIVIDAKDVQGGLPDLAEVLAHLPPRLRSVPWRLFDLWAVGRDDDLDVGELEERSATVAGLAIEGERLIDVGSRLLQVIDGVLVACDGEIATRHDGDARKHAAVALQVVDSGRWRIHAREADDLRAWRAAFPAHRVLETDEPITLEPLATGGPGPGPSVDVPPDEDERRRAFLVQRLEASLVDYEAGDLRLARLVREVEACIDALFDIAEEEWVEELRSAWGHLEIVHACALADGRSSLDAEDHASVARGIAELRAGVARSGRGHGRDGERRSA